MARFWNTHVALPVLAFLAATAVLQYGGGDLWLASSLLALEGGQWALRDHPLTEWVIHRGGRALSALGVFALAVSLLVAALRGHAAPWRPAARYLLASVLLSIGVVVALKRGLVVDCAWSVQGLGGVLPKLGLFDPRPPGAAPDHCYPAAHAGVGYAWLALYFAISDPRARCIGMLVGLALGLVFGVAQQLRGAHFASHDLASAMVCWLVAIACRPLLGRPASPGIG